MSYKYAHPTTSLNGIMNWLLKYLGKEKFYINFKTYGDLNIHLKQIRVKQEPNKQPSSKCEQNAIYIQKNYNFDVVINYFKNLEYE